MYYLLDVSGTQAKAAVAYALGASVSDVGTRGAVACVVCD